MLSSLYWSGVLQLSLLKLLNNKKLVSLSVVLDHMPGFQFFFFSFTFEAGFHVAQAGLKLAM